MVLPPNSVIVMFVILSCEIAVPFISLFYLLSSSLPLVEVQILSVCLPGMDSNHAGP